MHPRTVADLIAALAQMPQDAEVRLAQQPRWAFEYSIAGLTLLSDARRYAEAEVDEDGEPIEEAVADTDEPDVVYIAEGRQLGYLPVASELIWY